MNKLLQYINSKEFNSAANIVFWITIPLWVVLILYGQDIKDWRIKSFQAQQQKQKEKSMTKNKPVDRQKITSNDLSGNVESIHPWGRTEIVPMKSVELEYFEYCDEWVMYGDVVQPIGRKDYFMPVLRGRLDLNVKEMTQTWIEYGSYETGSIEKPETYEDFRMSHILVKNGRVINIKYTHYRLDSNKSWSIIASWEAGFNENL
jgi:hypothetical protein